jgi:hypothetical protein
VVTIADGDHNATIRGVLADAGDSRFTVETDEERRVVEYEDVLTAKTVFRWEKAPKPGH